MALSEARVEPRSRLLHCEPQLFVTDLERAIDYYTSRLGFDLAFSYGDPPFYAQVARDGARLNLRHMDRPAFDPAFPREEPDPLSATIALDCADPLFHEYEAKGADFHQRLRTEPWGAETFIVRDPDGNLICFAGPGT